MAGGKQKRGKAVQAAKKNRNGNRRKRVMGRDYPMPRKPWQDTPADALVKAEGGHGTDIRAGQRETASGARDKLPVQGLNPITKVVATVQDRAISYLALGIVLKSIKNGLLPQQTGTPVPYYAYRYIYDTIVSAMQGVVPALQAAPRWFWEILYAVKPKDGRCKTGSVSYSWNIVATGAPLDQVINIGSGAGSYSIFLGTGGTSPLPGGIDGFAVLGAVLPYTAALGQEVISLVWNTFRSDGMGELIGDPGLDNALMAYDTSSFSVAFPEIGESYFAQGGLRTTVYSERQIDSPLFAKFAQYQPPGTASWRGWHKTHVSALSPMYIAPRLSELDSLDQIRNKTPPTVKYYNFDEFFEVLSLTLCLALENMAKNAIAGLGAADPGGAIRQCPLTSQQAQILLRQAMLPKFCNYMAQDIRLQGANLVDLSPFVVGPNGAPPTNLNVYYPTVFVENIRACARLTSDLKSRYNKGRAVYDILPVLARNVEQNQLGNYTYILDGIAYPLYTLPTAGPVPETPINIVDCSATLAGPTPPAGTYYLDVSREALNVLAQSWNDWIQPLQAALSPLRTISSDQGVRALNCNLFTNFIVPTAPELPPVVAPPPTPGDAKRKGAEVKKSYGLNLHELRKKMGAAPVPGESDYFQSMGDKSTVSNNVVDGSIWNVLSKFVLPVSMSAGQVEDAGVQAWKVFNSELYEVPRSNVGGIGSALPGDNLLLWPTVYNRHLAMANLDAKMPTQDSDNEIVAFFLQADKDSRGGFLGDIVSTIAGAIGIPGLPGIAKKIGDITGL